MSLDPKTREAIEKFLRTRNTMMYQVLGADRVEEFIEELTPEILSDPQLFAKLFEKIANQDKIGEYGMGGDWWKAALTAEENNDDV